MLESIHFHEEIVKEGEKELAEKGGDLLKTDRDRMRLWEAVFKEDPIFRTKLVTLSTGDERAHIDSRNSAQSPKLFFELVTEQYNDTSWIPMSRKFGHFHSKFHNSFPLELEGEKLQVEQVT